MKDRILAAVPSRMSNFVIEQGAETLVEVEKKRTAFFDANKDIFSKWFDCRVKHWGSSHVSRETRLVNQRGRKWVSVLSKGKPHGREILAIVNSHTNYGEN